MRRAGDSIATAGWCFSLLAQSMDNQIADGKVRPFIMVMENGGGHGQRARWKISVE